MKERRRGTEAVLFVLSVFCWEQCKPLMCDSSFPPREKAPLPCPTAALILGWEYCNTQSAVVLAYISSCLCGIPPSLPHCWLLVWFFFCLFFFVSFHFISNSETCHILLGWKGDPLKIFANYLENDKTSLVSSECINRTSCSYKGGLFFRLGGGALWDMLESLKFLFFFL